MLGPASPVVRGPPGAERRGRVGSGGGTKEQAASRGARNGAGNAVETERSHGRSPSWQRIRVMNKNSKTDEPMRYNCGLLMRIGMT